MKQNRCQNANLIITGSKLISPNQFHNLFGQFIETFDQQSTTDQFKKSANHFIKSSHEFHDSKGQFIKPLNQFNKSSDQLIPSLEVFDKSSSFLIKTLYQC